MSETYNPDWEDNPEPVCPYCGQEYSNAREHRLQDEDADIFQCGHCKKYFYVTCSIRVGYSTLPITPEQIRHFRAEEALRGYRNRERWFRSRGNYETASHANDAVCELERILAKGHLPPR